MRLQACLCRATTVNALVENVKNGVFNPNSLILYCYCSASGKESFQQTRQLRLQLKSGLFPLTIFFASSFTVQSESTSLPVLIPLTFLSRCGLAADSSANHPTVQAARRGHSPLQQHPCPAIHHRPPCCFGRAALQYRRSLEGLRLCCCCSHVHGYGKASPWTAMLSFGIMGYTAPISAAL